MFVFEGAVALGNFRNLDLHHQGYYAIRVRISSGIGVSLAYSSWPVESNNCTVLDDTFCSSPIIVRYVEEAVPFNCGCQFRFDSRTDEVTLEVDLLFREFNGSPNLREIPPLSSFAIAQSLLFRIQSLTASPMIEFIPLVFSDRVACTVDAIFLTMLFSERPKLSSSIIFDTWAGLLPVERACGVTPPIDQEPSQGALFERWVALICHISTSGDLPRIIADRRLVHASVQSEQQRRSIFKESWVSSELTAVGERELMKTHFQVVAALVEENDTALATARMRVVDLVTNFHDSIHPIIFDQRYHTDVSRSSSFISSRSSVVANSHVVVLVHGLQGSAYDLRPLKTALQATNPELIFLSSQANQEVTDDDISIMGKRLGAEVIKFLKTL